MINEIMVHNAKENMAHCARFSDLSVRENVAMSTQSMRVEPHSSWLSVSKDSMMLRIQGSTSACAKSQEHPIALADHGEDGELESTTTSSKRTSLLLKVKRCDGA